MKYKPNKYTGRSLMKNGGKTVDGIKDANKSARREFMKGNRVAYKKGGSTQPEYKSGEMHQCKPL